MDENKLKPLSPLQRKFLAKLGETPAEHQAKISAIINKTYSEANSTSKVVNVHVLNKQTEAALTYSEPTADIVRRLEGTAYIAEEWVPQAHVLFIRHWRCRCGRSGSCLDLSSMFLRYRRSSGNVRNQTHGLPYLYLPVKSLTHPHLPRLKEVRFVSLVACEECFECRKVESSQQGDTSSMKCENPLNIPTSSDTASPLLQIEPYYLSNMRWEDDGGFCSQESLREVQVSGSACDELNQSSAAPAAPTNTPTTEVRANV
jgi:hypothetical protein